jgi:hypothetical protein
LCCNDCCSDCSFCQAGWCFKDCCSRYDCCSCWASWLQQLLLPLWLLLPSSWLVVLQDCCSSRKAG